MLTLLLLASLAGFAMAPGGVVCYSPRSSQALLHLVPTVGYPVAAGDSATVAVTIRVAEGFHVQANPAADNFLVPLKLELASVPGVSVAAIHYPSPTLYRLEGTAKDLLTYSGTFRIVVRLHLAPDAQLGHHVLRGTLAYQACDARSCRFPAELPVAVGCLVTNSVRAPAERSSSK